MGNPGKKRPLTRPNCGWKSNIKMYRKQKVIVWVGFSWLTVGITGLLWKTVLKYGSHNRNGFS